MLHGYDIKITDEDLNDSDKEEQKTDWTDPAFLFIRDFIYGVEGALYKRMQKTNELQKLKDENALPIGEQILGFYLSQVYSQFVGKTNALIVSNMTNIAQICNEKPLFMLILISKVIKVIYPEIPRNNFDIGNEKIYGQSVLNVLIAKKSYIVNELKESLKEMRESQKLKKDEINEMENKMKNIK